MMAWTILVEGHQRNISDVTDLTPKSKKAQPLSHDFWWIMMTWIKLEEGHQETFLQNYTEIGKVASDKKIFKVFHINILGK